MRGATGSYRRSIQVATGNRDIGHSVSLIHAGGCPKFEASIDWGRGLLLETFSIGATAINNIIRCVAKGGPMPAHVFVIHDEPEFADRLVGALSVAGHDVVAFVDPMVALDALDAAQRVELLITRIQFPPGKPNGIALARMTRFKRPDVRVVFTAPPELEHHAEGLGEFVSAPINIAEVVAIVERLLNAGGEEAT
jgi:CheY-like chemotaxis protein